MCFEYAAKGGRFAERSLLREAIVTQEMAAERVLPPNDTVCLRPRLPKGLGHRRRLVLREEREIRRGAEQGWLEVIHCCYHVWVVNSLRRLACSVSFLLTSD